ncbi:MAG: hypothetical protein M3A24_02685, partial [Candidatus Rhabdochlamydia oedothoracis]|nr:hypothetical protein [Candidatus Rhabdochlamydia oedothoracis]
AEYLKKIKSIHERSRSILVPIQTASLKEETNPTLRWIFQVMEGIGVVYFYDESLSYTIREVITNLNELRKKIILLFGEIAARMYGLIQKNRAVGLEM